MSKELYKEQGPILLLAAPGTGKTYNLAKRIKYLVEEKNIPPNNITVITFTSPAAKNMRDRISDDSEPNLYLSYTKQPSLICTMHSFGHKILRENAAYVGLLEDIEVIRDDTQKIIMGDAAQLCGFSRYSIDGTFECRQHGKCIPLDIMKCQICDKYRLILSSCSAIDHNDQILLSCKILKENPEILDKYKQCCRHLLVDEYQDINAAQFELISILSDEQRDGLFVVGDDDQSIYSWRGGSPEFIRNFEKDFGANAKILPLQKSFRCHKNVLEGAFSIVRKFDDNRLEKGEFDYDMEDGLKIQIHSTPSDEKEAKIIRYIVEKVLPSHDVLILYPTKYFARAIKEELRKAKITFAAPPETPGEGFPLISVLSKWLSDKNDSLSFRICLESLTNNPELNIPSVKSRKQELKLQRENAFKMISDLWNPIINKKLVSLWEALKLENEKNNLYSFAFGAFSKLDEIYEKNDLPNFAANIINFLTPWRNIEEFYQEIDSWVAASGKDDTYMHNVRLMSLYGAKGLEAKVVCVVGLEEGTLPRNDISEEQLREQSRLIFVSMTRAIKELHLFHARKRSGGVAHRDIFKKGNKPDIQPSRFLQSLSNAHAEKKYHPI